MQPHLKSNIKPWELWSMHRWGSLALEAFQDLQIIRHIFDVRLLVNSKVSCADHCFVLCKKRKISWSFGVLISKRSFECNVDLQQGVGDGRRGEESSQAPQPRSSNGYFMIFNGPRYTWGPIYGSRCLSVCKWCFVDLTDVSLVDEDINSILADDTDWAIPGNLEM